ncbi:MAG TPA: amino acid permease [Parvibaculum sp.]
MSTPSLRRVLTLWPLIFYGLGVIVGAGIYVAIGSVIARAGDAAPLAFLLAGVVAALTGLCYAELAGRFPEAAGAAAYVRRGFGSDRLSQIVGAAMTFAVAISAASIARGAVLYLVMLAPLPVPLLLAALIAVFTAVALLGVRESVGLAAAIGLLEIAGLIAATAAGLMATTDFHLGHWPEIDWSAWPGLFSGAFIAFFAFIGFETLANLGEEVKDPARTLPRGIVGAVAASIVLYIAVSSAAVLADRGPDNPLIGLFEGRAASVFAAVGFLSVANGVLVQIVMLSRLFYGMARSGQLPAWLGRIHARTRTPAGATLVAGAIVLAAALLVPFERLLVSANALTLLLFAVVDMALWRVKRKEPAMPGAFTVPAAVPPIAAALSIVLMLSELLG